MNRLSNFRAIITGGGSGIGRAIAKTFVREGAFVLVNDIDDIGGIETTEECNKINDSSAVFVTGDVSLEATWSAILKTIVLHSDRLDIVVNNAAYLHYGSVLETTEEDWDKHVAVNLKSLFWSANWCLPPMIEQRSGVFINIASVHAQIGFRNSCAYDICKRGVLGFTKSIAVDYASNGIRSNSISPGIISTHQNRQMILDKKRLQKYHEAVPLGRVGQPTDVAELAVYLASSDASYVTGADFIIDGGYLSLMYP